MSNYQDDEQYFEWHYPFLAVSLLQDNYEIYLGMRKIPVALVADGGYSELITVLIPPDSSIPLEHEQVVALKASIETFRMNTDSFELVFYGANDYVGILSDYFDPKTLVYCAKRAFADIWDELDDEGQLKTFSQEEAVERIGHCDWEEQHPALTSAAQVLYVWNWACEKEMAKSNPSFQ